MTTRLNHQADPATGFWRHVRAIVPRPSARLSYLGAVTLVGLVLFFTQAPQFSGNPFILAALIATELALSTMPVRIYGTTTVYVSYVVTLVIYLLIAVVVGGPSSIIGPSPAPKPPSRPKAIGTRINATTAGRRLVMIKAMNTTTIE